MGGTPGGTIEKSRVLTDYLDQIEVRATTALESYLVGGPIAEFQLAPQQTEFE